jgi:hypothetical protein
MNRKNRYFIGFIRDLNSSFGIGCQCNLVQEKEKAKKFFPELKLI